MVEEVLSVITKWQSNERLASLGEAMVQQVIVLPIFRGLGWDPDNDREVHPQYPVEDGKVDYALLIGSAVKVFIEVKNGGESLGKHQEQLLGYSFKRGVRIAALTNGAMWWFYLPLQEGSWEQRKFYAVEFDKQNGAEIAQKFVDLLSKENVSSWKAVQNAEDLRNKRQISETFPEAWNQLVSETNSSIVELLAERTRELCGSEPDKNNVKQFLSEHIHQIKITSSAVAPPTPDPPTESEPSNSVTTTQPTSFTAAPDLTFTKPTSFTFNAELHRVESWSGMMVKLCEIVREAHRDRFDERVLNIRGPNGATDYSRNGEDLENARLIEGTTVNVETHGGGKDNVPRAERLITAFGYERNNFGYSAVRRDRSMIRVRM